MQGENFKIDYDKQLMNKLGKITNILRGKLDIMDMLSVSLMFAILRRIDCFIGNYAQEMADCYNEVKDKSDDIILSKMTVASHNNLYYNYSGLNFDQLLQHPGEIDLYVNFYANCFNESVNSVLTMMDFTTLIAKMKHEKCIYDVVNLFASIDLGPTVSSVEICKVFRSITQYRDEFYTPELYCYYAQVMLFGKEIESDNVRIYDPVCGLGNLLNAIYFNALQVHSNKQIHVYGQDLAKFPATIMAICSLLLGDNPNNIKTGNTIMEDLLPEMTFQYIVADLPMGMPWKAYSDEVYKETELGGRYWMGVPRTDSQLLFIQHIISKMDPSGSRAVIFTNSLPLNGGDNDDSNIRKIILEKDLLETIVALPKISGQTNVQRFLWVLSNKKAEHRKGKVHLIDANYMKEIEKEYIKDDMSLVSFIYQFYDIDFPEPYHCYINNKDFGNYKIYIRDNKRDKIQTVDVPLSQNPTEYLVKRNIISDKDNSTEILYDKTTDFYAIDFSKYFTKKEKYRPSEEIYEDVHTTVMAMYEFERELHSMPLPDVHEDLIQVENHVYTEVPKSWAGMYLSEILEFENGKKYSETEYKVGAIPILSITDYRDTSKEPTSYTLDGKIVKVSEEDIVLVSGGSNSGDIVYGRAGALGRNLILAKRKSDLLHEDYLYYLLSSLHLNDYSKGNVIKRLSVKDLENIFIYLPSYEEQERMVQYMYRLEGAIAGVCESSGVYIPSFMEYEKAIFFEIVTGKYKF